MQPDDRRLSEAAAALGLALSEQQRAQLLQFLAELGRWNNTYNLTALRDPQAMLTHHIVDCLAAVPSVVRWAAGRRGLTVLDVGSGGGLPGLVWAILMPEVEVTCIDAVGKKAAFVRHTAGLLGLNVKALHARVESLAATRFDLITSRAFSSLGDFTRLTRSALAPGGAWLAMKGKSPEAEISALDPSIKVFHVEQLDVPDLGAERCLVWMSPDPASEGTGHPPG
jgi:16S rRNA (guanine527-N7)-methyltransferase